MFCVYKNGQLTGDIYLRQDEGYFWHNNETKTFEKSLSFGCIISTKADMDRVAATIKADTNPKSVKTITVVQPRETVSIRESRGSQDKPAREPVRAEPRASKPMLR